MVERVGDKAIDSGIAFHLALIDKHSGQTLPIAVRRGEHADHPVECTLVDLPLAKPVPEEGLEAGLNFAAWPGNWQQLPNLRKSILLPRQVGHRRLEAAVRHQVVLVDDRSEVGTQFGLLAVSTRSRNSAGSKEKQY